MSEHIFLRLSRFTGYQASGYQHLTVSGFRMAKTIRKPGPFDNRTRIEFNKTGQFGFWMLTVSSKLNKKLTYLLLRTELRALNGRF